MINSFKQKLADKHQLLGLWQSLAYAYSAEICAMLDYDWLLFDAEHAPNTVSTLLAQLQAVEPYAAEAVIRLPGMDRAIIKQCLDIGFRTLLVPMVDTVAQAEQIVRATRYPPDGERGVASGTSRAARFGTTADYLSRANDQMCVVVQLESAAALEAAADIAVVDGIDAVFVGPGDLAADIGLLGQPRHDEVRRRVGEALERVAALGKPFGIFATSPADARYWMERGVTMISIGSDIGSLQAGARSLLTELRP